jgi:uncharacterized protein YbcI
VNQNEAAIVLPVSEDGYVHISQSEVQLIAEAAAEKAVEKIRAVIYEEVGKSALKWIAYLIGATIIVAFMWLASKGSLPK